MICPDCGCRFADNRRVRLFSIGTINDRNFFRVEASKCPSCGQPFIEEADISNRLRKIISNDMKLEAVGDINNKKAN